MAKKKKPQKKTVDFQAIRDAASGQWSEIIQSVCSIPAHYLDGRHQGCPICGMGKDCWRVFDDFETTGGAICNKCNHNMGDGIKLVAHQQNCSNFEAAVKIAQHLGIKVEGNRRRELAIDQLSWRPWNDLLVYYWTIEKPPITPEAVAACGGQLVRYAKRVTALAFPVRGEKGVKEDPVGWVLYNTTGGDMPIFKDGEISSVVKVKTLSGSKAGLIGVIRPSSGIIYKVEGPTDVLTLVSQGLKPDESVVCNVHGCNEDPRKTSWFSAFFKGRSVVVIGDNDEPGQKGAETWSQYIAKTADQCWLAKLPGPTKANHGDDLRDYFLEGHTRADFDKLVAEASIVDPNADEPVVEAPDDPDRLARVILQLYKSQRATRGREIRFWQGEWYIWNTRHYERKEPYEIKAVVWEGVKAEFDRLYWEEEKEYEEGRRESSPVCRKVKETLVKNVMSAIVTRIRLPNDRELNTWGEKNKDRSNNIISMANGLLNVDSLVPEANQQPEDNPRKDEPTLFEHTPDWFSTAHLPYKFDEQAMCREWTKFLDTSMENDHERINVLQEWAGLLLLPDTSAQKMMILTGEGANGKSVFCAGMEAMLVPANCSHVQFENIKDRFHNTATLGKLLNVCADVSDHEVIGEGVIKSFCSGDRMMFDRKNRSPIEAAPTARLMLACNNLPRTKDRTEGMYRRMLLIPWNRQVPKGERVHGMDKVKYWVRSKELPGIFRWALLGLARYREQGETFTSCRAMDEALGVYREHNNPALAFIKSHLQAAEATSSGPAVRVDALYRRYVEWCDRNGLRFKLQHAEFGKEIKRHFKGSDNVQRRDRGEKVRVYVGIDYQEDVITFAERDDAYTNPNGGF